MSKKEQPKTYLEPQMREEKESAEGRRVAIGSLSSKLEKRYISRNKLVRAHIKREAHKAGLTKEQYLENKYFSAKYSGKEYLFILAKPSEGSKVETAYTKDGPVIYIDNDIPKKLWEVILVHEITEMERFDELKKKLSSNEIAKERAHADALVEEEEYGKNYLSPEDYKEYQEWQKRLRY